MENLASGTSSTTTDEDNNRNQNRTILDGDDQHPTTPTHAHNLIENLASGTHSTTADEDYDRNRTILEDELLTTPKHAHNLMENLASGTHSTTTDEDDNRNQNRTILDGDDQLPTTPTHAHNEMENIASGTHGVTDEDADQLPILDKRPVAVTYSLAHLRLVVGVSAILYAASTGGPLTSQYLLDFWENRLGYNDTGPSHVTSYCDQNESEEAIVKKDEIQSRVSETTMFYHIANAIPSLLSCLIFGAISDLIGRRPLFLISVFGTIVQITISIFIIALHAHPDYFYIPYIINGLSGGFYVNFTACFAMISDAVHEKDSRILTIVLFSLAAAITSSVMSLVLGKVIETSGYWAGYSVILILLLVSFATAYFFMPETRTAPRQRVTPRVLWNYTARIYYLFCKDGDRRTRWSLWISMLIFFTGSTTTVNISSMDTLFQRHQPLCWNSENIAIYSAARMTVESCLGFVYWMLWRHFRCFSDEMSAMVGMVFSSGSLILQTFVENSWQMYLVPLVSSPSQNVAPITRGVMSVLAGPEKQGVLFSSVAVAEVLCNIIAFTVFNEVYAVTVHWMPGTVYLVMALCSIIAVLLYIPFFYFYDNICVYDRMEEETDVT